MIVSDIAGTTRDAIDTEIVHDGREYVFIDTAGLRRKSKIKEELERYSIIRTVTAVERADVVLMVIDAVEGVTEQDAKIAGIAHERGKGVIIVVNKWDAIEKNDKTMREYEGKIRNVLSYMPYAEIMYISAKTGQRIHKLFEMIDMVIENQSLRIATGVLNEIMTEAVAMQQPPSDKGKRLKLYYITQVSVKPPTFVIFVNDKELMHFSYTRYLENKIREAFGFRGTSLKFLSGKKKGKGEINHGTDRLYFDRVYIWPFPDRISLWKDESCGYPEDGKRQRRLHQCTSDTRSEGRGMYVSGRFF